MLNEIGTHMVVYGITLNLQLLRYYVIIVYDREKKNKKKIVNDKIYPAIYRCARSNNNNNNIIQCLGLVVTVLIPYTAYRKTGRRGVPRAVYTGMTSNARAIYAPWPPPPPPV